MSFIDFFKQDIDEEEKAKIDAVRARPIQSIEQEPVAAPTPIPAPVESVRRPEPVAADPLADTARHVADKKQGLTVIDGIAQMFGGKAGSTAGTKADLDNQLGNARADDARRKQELLQKYKMGRAEKSDAREDATSDPQDPLAKANRLLVAKRLLPDIPQEQKQEFLDSLDKMGSADLAKIANAGSSGLTEYQRLSLQLGQRRADQSDERAKLQERNIANRESRTAVMRDKYGYQISEKFEDDARNALKDMRQTETWKSAEKTLSEIPTMKNLLADASQYGGQSLSMLGPKVAKGIAGEVGVLTDQDVTRYVKNPALVDGLVDTLVKLKSGQISDVSHDNLMRLLEISEKTAAEKLERAVQEGAVVFARRENMPVEDARYYIDASFNGRPPERNSLSEPSAPPADKISIPEQPQEPAQFPRQVKNQRTGEVATVSNESELTEALEAGFE